MNLSLLTCQYLTCCYLLMCGIKMNLISLTCQYLTRCFLLTCGIRGRKIVPKRLPLPIAILSINNGHKTTRRTRHNRNLTMQDLIRH